MTRLIDADAMKEYIDAQKGRPFIGCTVGEAFKIMTDEQPTVEAVPVIRCRDCKFLRFTGTVWKCQNRLVMMLCEPNDYCSRAERKEE